MKSIACALPLILLYGNVVATEEASLSGNPTNTLQANAELGYGHEHYSARLVRFNDEGPLIEIVGRRNTSGDFRHLSASLMKSIFLSQDLSIQASAAMWNRHFQSAPDLDIGMVSIDGIIRYQIGESSVGLGPTLQQIASGGRHFRSRKSVQLDWTHAKENQGHTSIVLEIGSNSHSEEFRDLDGRSGLLLLRKQFTAPIKGIQELSVEAGIVREVNRFGYADLSNRQLYSRIGLDFEALGLEWNLSGTLQKAKFDAPFIGGLPARKDIFSSGELSASYSFSKSITLRATFSGYQNQANVVLYDGRFRGNSLSLNASF